MTLGVLPRLVAMHQSLSDTNMNNNVLIPGNVIWETGLQVSQATTLVIKLYLSCQQFRSTLEPKDSITCTAMFIAHEQPHLKAAVRLARRGQSLC